MLQKISLKQHSFSKKQVSNFATLKNNESIDGEHSLT